MKTNLKAQSALEYALIIAVAVAAISVMGIYVQRSVQANFKMVEERINPDSGAGAVPTGEEGGPGDSSCGNGSCDAGEDNLGCPGDCFCGDDICSPSENLEGESHCQEDCGPLLE